MLPEEKLDLILRRYAEISDRLAEGPDSTAYVALSRELSEIEDVAGAIRDYRAALKEIEELKALIADRATDAEMRALAEAENAEAADRVAALENQLRLALLPKDAADEKSAILEI